MLKSIIKNFRLKHTFAYSVLSLVAIFVSFFINGSFNIVEILKILLIVFIFSIYAFTSNNHCDRNCDKLNPRKLKSNPIASGEISENMSIAINVVLILIIVGLTEIWFSLLTPFMAFSIFAVTFYSYKAKTTPILDMIFHWMFLSSFIIFPELVLRLDASMIIMSYLITLAYSNIIEIENQIDDYKSDKASKVNTTTVKFGTEKSKLIYYFSSMFLIVLCICSAILYNMYLLSLFSLYPLYKIYFLRKSR